MAQIDRRDAGRRETERSRAPPPGHFFEKKDEAKERGHRSGAAHGARRIEQSGGPHDSPAVGTDVGRALEDVAIHREGGRKFRRHPAARVVHLQNADDRVDPVADQQNGEHSNQRSTTFDDEGGHPEERAEHGHVQRSLSDPGQQAVGVRVQNHREQANHHESQPAGGRMTHASPTARAIEEDRESQQTDQERAGANGRTERLIARNVEERRQRGLTESEPFEKP